LCEKAQYSNYLPEKSRGDFPDEYRGTEGFPMRIRGGLRTNIGVAAAGIVVAGGVLIGGASSVSAPEPARLDGYLTGTNTTTLATYVSSLTKTKVVQFGSSWAPGSWPAGTPCVTYNAPPGTVTTQIIYATGNYRKCM
jgi:hypothetical protein